MNTLRILVLLVVGALSASHSASAHPVAQGVLEVQISSGTIHIQARVSGEEVFVANAFAPSDAPKAATLPEVWQHHGDYLLRHLKVWADGQRVEGRVLGVAASTNDFVVYQLEFPVAAVPARVRLEEDLLNEIEYAPGNAWEASFVVRVRQNGLTRHDGLLLSRQQPLEIACTAPDSIAGTTPGRGRMMQQYVRHGIGHILSGYDHLLFVAALVLGAATFWDLVKVVTAFTLAHTVTLTLCVLNIVRLPSQIVEPMIAGSIVFVAASNFLWPKRSRDWVRLALAFFFGLFHGLGFAGGLLSATESLNGFAVGLAILAFSLGVEMGHQMVVLPLFLGLKAVRALRSDAANQEWLSLTMQRGGSLLIAVVGVIYLVAALR